MKIAALLVVFGMCRCSDVEKVDDTEKVRAFIGVAFRHKMKDIRYKDPASERVFLDLLTADGKKLLETTWVKLQWLNNEVYGFPLEGNQGVKTYIVRRTPKEGLVTSRSVKVFVNEIRREFFHEIKMCTSLTNNEFLKNLNTRYTVIEKLANYFLRTEVDNIKMRDFSNGCVWFSFLHLENGKKCDRDKMNELKSRMFDGNRVSKNLRKELNDLMTILSINITLTGECLKPRLSSFQTKLEWLKSVAPLLLLGAVVMIPVGISCYVCRGVRRRQNAMRQLQDKRMKEEQQAMTEQINTYKEFCAMHEEANEEPEKIQAVPKWKDSSDEKKKKTFLKNMFEQYVPYSIQDKIDQSTAILDNPNAKKLMKKQKKIDLFAKFLRIQTPAMKKREERLLNDKNQRKQRKRAIYQLNGQIQDTIAQQKQIQQASVLKSSNPRLPMELRKMSLSTKPSTAFLEPSKRRKSVSFIDLTKTPIDSSGSVYRTANVMAKTNSSSSVPGTSLEFQGAQKSILSRKLSSVLPPVSEQKQVVAVADMNKLPPKSNYLQPVNAQMNGYVSPNNSDSSSLSLQLPAQRKRSVIESVKTLAIVGKEKISLTIKEGLIGRTSGQLTQATTTTTANGYMLQTQQQQNNKPYMENHQNTFIPDIIKPPNHYIDHSYSSPLLNRPRHASTSNLESCLPGHFPRNVPSHDDLLDPRRPNENRGRYHSSFEVHRPYNDLPINHGNQGIHDNQGPMKRSRSMEQDKGHLEPLNLNQSYNQELYESPRDTFVLGEDYIQHSIHDQHDRIELKPLHERPFIDSPRYHSVERLNIREELLHDRTKSYLCDREYYHREAGWRESEAHHPLEYMDGDTTIETFSDESMRYEYPTYNVPYDQPLPYDSAPSSVCSEAIRQPIERRLSAADKRFEFRKRSLERRTRAPRYMDDSRSDNDSMKVHDPPSYESINTSYYECGSEFEYRPDEQFNRQPEQYNRQLEQYNRQLEQFSRQPELFNRQLEQFSRQSELKQRRSMSVSMGGRIDLVGFDKYSVRGHSSNTDFV